MGDPPPPTPGFESCLVSSEALHVGNAIKYSKPVTEGFEVRTIYIYIYIYI
uniref:Uncharacterized protein n=1 Tax=Octopus bimaculoides TaxID=37653 RepID=A0A0L8I292_OCTBM